MLLYDLPLDDEPLFPLYVPWLLLDEPLLLLPVPWFLLLFWLLSFTLLLLRVRSRVMPSIQFTLLCWPLGCPVCCSSRVRWRVTPERDALLRVLLGRSYTLSVLFLTLSVRPCCAAFPFSVRDVCAVLVRLVRGVVARTPRSALDGPDARGTKLPPPLRPVCEALR